MIHVLATVPPGDFANGFGIATGFIAFIVILYALSMGVYHGRIGFVNPLAPLVRWVDRWQEHRYRMAELRLRVKLKRDDPDYTTYLEQKKDDPA